MVGTLVTDMSSAITCNFGDYEIVGGHCKDNLRNASVVVPAHARRNYGKSKKKLQKSAAHGVILWLHLEV